MKINSNLKLKNSLPDIYECTVCVIGLGYVGLPLAIEIFLNNNKTIKKQKVNRNVIGFDINSNRINELNNNFDKTNEISQEILKQCSDMTFTSEENALVNGDIFIVTTPTPIDDCKKPDLSLLKLACKTIGKSIKLRSQKFDSDDEKKYVPIIIFESTVYPGVTEEICVPIVEKESGLSFHGDNLENTFVCGYSPERINPGDNNRKLSDIKKVTSGSNIEVGLWIDSFYSSFINAGTYLASSIKVAEAAKVIENTQRDLNIALVNELSIILKKLNIDTLEVLKAAETKWNFIPFRPGLVGGHCIGVDPYYLTYKAEQIGYYPEVVLAGRRINDSMPEWISEQLVLNLVKKGKLIKGTKLLILGLTFKENCPDFRNSKVFDLINFFIRYGFNVDVVDPHINEEMQAKENVYNLRKSTNNCTRYDAIVLTIAHKEFLNKSIDEWRSLINNDGIIFDIKGIVPKDLNPIRI